LLLGLAWNVPALLTRRQAERELYLMPDTAPPPEPTEPTVVLSISAQDQATGKPVKIVLGGIAGAVMAIGVGTVLSCCSSETRREQIASSPPAMSSLDIASENIPTTFCLAPGPTGPLAVPLEGANVPDHIVPLACDGPDAISNMQWQTIADAKAKDRWERRTCGR
jgi:hypothetical protein